MKLRIASVDMDGFCGRDYHPNPAMVGEVVTVCRSYVERDEIEGEDFRVFECERADGSRVDLVEFEIEHLDDAGDDAPEKEGTGEQQ